MKQSSKTCNDNLFLYIIIFFEYLTINITKSMIVLKMNIIYDVKNTACTITTCILNNQICDNQNV